MLQWEFSFEDRTTCIVFPQLVAAKQHFWVKKRVKRPISVIFFFNTRRQMHLVSVHWCSNISSSTLESYTFSIPTAPLTVDFLKYKNQRCVKYHVRYCAGWRPMNEAMNLKKILKCGFIIWMALAPHSGSFTENTHRSRQGDRDQRKKKEERPRDKTLMLNDTLKQRDKQLGIITFLKCRCRKAEQQSEIHCWRLRRSCYVMWSC